MSRLIVFPDTNIFLQCKPIQELPWSEIGVYDEIHIVVALTVVQELDDHSHGSSDRRARRARKALGLFDAVNKSATGIHVVQEASPHISIAVGDPPPTGETLPYPLRGDVPDHRILFEYLSLAKTYSSEPHHFMALDRAAITQAKKIGLNWFQVPDGWRLPPEATDQEKKIRVLEDQVKAFQQIRPVIELTLVNAKGDPIKDEAGTLIRNIGDGFSEPIAVTLQHYPDLNLGQIREITELAKTMHPMQTLFPTQEPSVRKSGLVALDLALRGHKWMAPKQEDIEHYQNTSYPNWVISVDAWTQKISRILNKSVNQFFLRIAMTNTGGVPAETTLITFEVIPNGLGFGSSKKIKAAKGPPPYPIPPAGKYINMYEAFTRFGDNTESIGFSNSALLGLRNHLNLNNPKHDPHAFYYHPKAPILGSNHHSLLCDLFRHKVDPEVFTLAIKAFGNGPHPEKGVLKVQVTAKNLPAPVKATIPLRIKYETLNTFDAAKHLLSQPDTGT